MSNIRDLKKEINYVVDDIIDAVYIWEFANGNKSTKKSEAIIDEALAMFNELIDKINAKNIENKKAHFKAINQELQDKGHALIDKINKL